MYDHPQPQHPGGYAMPYGNPYGNHYGGPPMPVYGPETGSWGARLVAYLIDSFLSSLLFYAVLAASLFAVLGMEELVGRNPQYGDLSTAAGLTALIGVAGAFLLLFCYWWVPVARSGKTPGKRLLGIKVVAMSTGEPPSMLQALWRYCFMVLISFTLVGFFIDCLWPLWDQPYRQSLHDKVAGTYVIRG